MITPHLLTREEEIDQLIGRSHERPTFLFKHSLICPMSSSAWHRFLSFVNEEAERGRAEFMAVEIQKARPVSDGVARVFEVRHESPQALLVSEGEVVWHASHGSITEESLAEALERISE